MLNIVHIVNQFFAGIGGKDKADTPVGVLEQPSAVTRAPQSQLGGQARVTATLYFGDNYFHEHTSEATDAILREIRTRKPHVIVAGPAFNSGRYGLACVEICNSIANEVEIPCVTAMHPENPAVSTYQDYHNSNLFLLPTSETAVGMARALGALARFAWKMGSGIKIGPVQSLLEPVLAIGKGYLYCVISKFFLLSQRKTTSKGRDDVSPEANHLRGLEVALKSGISEETAQKLVAKVHSVVSASPESFGGAQVSLVHSKSGIFMGGYDPQKDSCVIGF